MIRSLFLLLTSLLLTTAITAASHPYADWPAELPSPDTKGVSGLAGQGTWTPERNLGDLTFHAPYAPAESLSSVERYMLWGATNPDTATNVQAWIQIVYPAIWAFHSRHGYLPEHLTAEALRSCLGGTYTDEQLDVFRNPITGEWPRLKAAEHSPGDLYCHALTAEEVAHFNAGDTTLRMGATGNSWSGAVMPVGQPNAMGPIYVRIYGHDDVILSRIMQAVWH